jgi:hypothetical protein
MVSCLKYSEQYEEILKQIKSARANRDQAYSNYSGSEEILIN